MRKKIFPYEKFKIQTRYSMEQVRTILDYHIAPVRTAAKEYGEKEFCGK